MQFAGVLLDEKVCLAIAEHVPSWSRHLQRLCGKPKGQIPLTQGLMDNIMGCTFLEEGDALTSRWAGGFIQLFCMQQRRQCDDGMCGCPRCYALQDEVYQITSATGDEMYQPLPRPEGKLCFMELTEAVAASHPRFLSVGDAIDTATWGQFVVMDAYSTHWLNDYSIYFATACDRSWDKAVALHVGTPPSVDRVPRHVTEHLCTQCCDVEHDRICSMLL